MTFPHSELDRVIADFDGDAGVYLKDLATQTVYEHDAGRRFPTASVCKVAVMIELFRRAEEGSLNLLDRHRLPPPPAALPAAMTHMRDEPELTLWDYCRLMIDISDNTATDYLTTLLTPARINATMEELGFHDTRTNFTIGEWHAVMKGADPADVAAALEQPAALDQSLDPDSLAYSDSLDNNVTSAHDQGRIMEQLFYGQLISPKASAHMLDILKATRENNKLRRMTDYGTVVAHKTGGSNRIQADVGIAFLPTGPLVVCILTLARESRNAAFETVESIARLAVGALSPQCLATG